MDDQVFKGLAGIQYVDGITGEDITKEVLSPCFRRDFRRPIHEYVLMEEETTCQQHLVDTTDVHQIYERCMREGIDPATLPGKGPGQFADCTELQASTLTEHLERLQQTVDAVQEFLDSPVPEEEVIPSPPVEPPNAVPSSDSPTPT